jgi:hypothetical protein
MPTIEERIAMIEARQHLVEIALKMLTEIVQMLNARIKKTTP